MSEALDHLRAFNDRFVTDRAAPGVDDLDLLRKCQASLRPTVARPEGEVREAWNIVVRLYQAGGWRDDVILASTQALDCRLGSPELLVRYLSVSFEMFGPRATLDSVRERSLDRVDAADVQAVIAKIEYELGEYFLASSRARRALDRTPDTSTASGILILSLLGLDEVASAAQVVTDHPEYGLDCSWAVMPLILRLHREPALSHLVEPVSARFLDSRTSDRDLWEARILSQTDRRDRAEALLRTEVSRRPDDGPWGRELLRLQLDAFDGHTDLERFEYMLAHHELPEPLRQRTESAVRCAGLIASGRQFLPRGSDAIATRLPDSLFEHVLHLHRNRTYVPVPERTALLGATLGPGGAERVLGVAWQGLVAAGADVRLWLYSLDSGRADDFYLNELGIARDRVTLLPMPSSVPEPFSWLPQGVSENAYRAYLQILEERPETVHGWQDGVNAELVFAAIVAGVPNIVLHPHNMRPDLVHRTDFAKSYLRIYKAAMERSEVRMVFVSEACRRDYLHWMERADDTRTSVVYNGFDLLPLSAEEKLERSVLEREGLGIPAEGFVVGTAFRFSEIKRPLLWVEIAREVANRIANAHFVLFGDGPLKAEVVNRIHEYGLTDRFTLPGRSVDLPGKLAMFDAYLLTSSSEGLPTVLIEAQFAGVPVVASAAGGGTAECLIDGKTGWLVESDEVDDYASRLVDVRASSRRYERARGAREEFVRGRFGRRRMIESLLDVYGDASGRALRCRAAMPEPCKYLLAMPWGRVGSNLLTSILGQTGPVRGANETFNAIAGADEQLAWLTDHFSAREGEGVGHAISCKQSLYSMVDPAAVAGFCRDHGVKIVRMTRDDHLKAAVSQMRAKEYAELTLREEGSARWGVKHDATPLGPTVIDPVRLRQVMAIMRRTQFELKASFGECDVIDVEYEQLNDDLDLTVRRVADFLGVDAGSYTVPFRKATSDDLSEVVLNLDEVLDSVGNEAESSKAAA